MIDEPVQNNRRCFCCGDQNEKGLKLKFRHPEPGRAETDLVIPEYFSGWENLTHGGLISMLLDEIMAHACLSLGLTGVTAELTVRFKKPLPVGTEVTVCGRVEEQKARIAVTAGDILDADGTCYASAGARFVKT